MSCVGDCRQTTEDPLQSPGVRTVGWGECSNGDVVHIRENHAFGNQDMEGRDVDNA